MKTLHTLLLDLSDCDDFELDFDLVELELRAALEAEADVGGVFASQIGALPSTYAGFVLRVAAATGHKETLDHVGPLLIDPEPVCRMDAAAACILLDDSGGEAVLSKLIDISFSGQLDANGCVVASHWITDILAEIGDHPVADALRSRIREYINRQESEAG